jgi:hypothetical protein
MNRRDKSPIGDLLVADQWGGNRSHCDWAYKLRFDGEATTNLNL